MPSFPIVDAHIHLYDGSSVPYGWMADKWPTIRHPHMMPGFDAARGVTAVDAVAFCEVHPDEGHHLDEAAFIEEVARSDPRIRAITAIAPLERGDRVEEDLVALKRFPLVRGVRKGFGERIASALEPGFVAGVRTLGRLGLHFEIGVPHWALGYALELARRCPDVPMVLNHIGMPDIRNRLWHPWREQIVDFARLDHVTVKVSGAMAGAGAGAPCADVVPFVRHVIERFGVGRCMFASDWPALSLTHGYADWIEVVDTALHGATPDEQLQLYRRTADRVFRLGL